MPDAKPNLPTDWNDVAAWYDDLVGEDGSEYHRRVVLPGTMRLLRPVAGERFVDVAAGQGVLCRLMREAGAEATGVDLARDLVELARQRGPADVRYFVGDAKDLAFLPEKAFDSAACVLAIQNIHPIGPVMAGVARVLKPRGRFVIVMMHPAFRGAKESHWGWDDKAKVQYRRVDRYLLPRKSPIVTHPGKDAGGYTWTFHKPLEMYVRALRNAGLLIDAIEEWPSHKTSAPGARQAAENQSRKEIPMFMAIRAIKVGSPTTGEPEAE